MRVGVRREFRAAEFIREKLRICILLLGSSLACCSILAADPEPADPTPPGANAKDPASARFDQALAPLISQRCLDCHNKTARKGGLDLSSAASFKQGGDSGPVFVMGNAEQSLLWQRLNADEMPPRKQLSRGEKELFKNWLEAGAKWGTDPIDPFRHSTERRAGYDWWALQPIGVPQVPAVKQPEWIRNPVDAFILAELEHKGLQPAAEAARGTLIRRLSFDLLGLPPRPEDVAAFIVNESPRAYAELVDHYLNSPAYGERWGRHWLDIARFGESQGFERDKLRPNSWRYRDWVIQAFNRDLPYDEFIRLQLAGDLLHPDDPLAVVATGFLVAAPWDETGHSQQSAAMRAVVRQDELEDLVGTSAQTFLGLTVNCARCHDHKFDPVLQSEYYRMAADLGGVQHGERESLLASGQPKAAARRHELDEKLAGLSAELAAIDDPIREQIRRERDLKAHPVPPQPIARWDFGNDFKDQIGSLHGSPQGAARLEGGRLLLDGTTSYVVTSPLEKNLEAKTLEAWVLLANLRQGGGGVISVQTLDGITFDGIVFGERETGKWIAGSNGFVRTRDLEAPLEAAGDTEFVHVAIVYHADQTIALYRNGQLYGKPYQGTGLVNYLAGKAQVVFGLRHAPAAANKLFAGAIDRAQLYDRALTPEEIAASAGVVTDSVSEDQLRAALSSEQLTKRDALQFALSELNLERRLLAGGPTYAVVPREPEPTFVLDRGNPATPKEIVSPGGIAAVATLPAEFDLQADAPDAARRLKLAEWIADRRNPLTPRVIVNRLWHYHFGVGIVDTPNDFGFNGGRPSHRELLNWLAAELLRENWSLKQLHRTLLLSATYRQSSRPNAAALQVDADNRLLWRMTPRRLEAEAVRDAILCIAGELNPTMGGPGYHDFKTYTRNSQFYEMGDPVGFQFQRRSVYRTWVRSGRNPLLDALDCPDPSTTAPKRAVTTTPLQALALLNNSFTLRMADRFAERLQRDVGTDTARQIRRAYELIYARPALQVELDLAQNFVAEQGLPAFCRVLFNSNEFLYVD